MKTSIVILGLVLASSAYAQEADSTYDYQAEYDAGVEYFEEGNLRAASDALLEAISISPTPSDKYLPYIYFSAAQFEMGNTLEARDALIKSQVFGVAARTKNGKLLLDRYAADIMSAPLDNHKYVPTPKAERVAATEKVVVPAEQEVVAPVKQEVVVPVEQEFVVPVEQTKAIASAEEMPTAKELKRCVKAAERSDNDMPWHFHYKCGVDLMNAGETEEAVDSFLTSANSSKDPSRGKRMYGMWFIDYLPYYQIALAHSKLGDWESAQNAIETSESFGEFSPADADYGSFRDLDQLIKSHLDSTDS